MNYAGKYRSAGFTPRNEPWTPEVRSPYVRPTATPPSLNGGVDTRPATRADKPLYSGTTMLGIATMHKSNAVPVFNPMEARDVASMRR